MTFVITYGNGILQEIEEKVKPDNPDDPDEPRKYIRYAKGRFLGKVGHAQYAL